MTERWGVAEDGVHVRIDGDLHGLDAVWPPVGLLLTDVPEAPTERSIVIRATSAEAVSVEIDGGVATGGWDRVESELALFAADHLRELIAIHAAVIVADGRALVLPGPSHSGKSSLAHAAWRAGATVASDEFALVSVSTGAVSGWQRPLRLRHSDGSVERLDAASEHASVPPGLVALLFYEPLAEDRWEEVPPSEAVLRILSNTVSARTRPNESFDVACRLAESVPVLEGPRGEAMAAVERLLDRMMQLSP